MPSWRRTLFRDISSVVISDWLRIPRAVYYAAWSYVFGEVVPFTQGRRVTFIYKRDLMNGHVTVRAADGTIYLYANDLFAPTGRTDVIVKATTDTYGIDWCYGWEGPAVDALRAAKALT